MEKKNSSGSMDLPSTLLVIFIVLKLCDVITWSWWWVLSPLWITLIMAFTVFIIVATTERWDK